MTRDTFRDSQNHSYPPWHNPAVSVDLTSRGIRDAESMFNDVGAARYVRGWRATQHDGTIDIERTARNAGVARISRKLTYAPTRTGQSTLFREDERRYRIIEHVPTSEAQRKFLIGHEIGHIALFSINGDDIENYFQKARDSEAFAQRQENFCDYFSLRLIGFSELPTVLDWDALPLADGTPTQNPWRLSSEQQGLF